MGLESAFCADRGWPAKFAVQEDAHLNIVDPDGWRTTPRAAPTHNGPQGADELPRRALSFILFLGESRNPSGKSRREAKTNSRNVLGPGENT